MKKVVARLARPFCLSPQYVNSLNGKVLFCNRCDGTDFFENRKGKLNLTTFPVTYTAGRRKKIGDSFEAKKAIEVLLYS